MLPLKEKLWFRILLFTLVQPLLPPPGIIPTFLHEGAHWLTAVLLGVAPTEIKIGWYGVGPGVTVPEWFPLEYLPYFRYAGGLSAGIVVLILYIFVWMKLYKENPTRFNWGIGAAIIVSSAFQFALGYMEGNRFGDYVRGTLTLQIAVSAVFVAALLFHMGVTYLLKKPGKKFSHNVKVLVIRQS